MKSRGFTLVELLVALTLFGLISAAGVALLSVSARSQETADERFGALGEHRRLQALLTADLGQAAPRLHRDAEGRRHRAFESGPEPLLFGFVRRGWDNPQGVPRPTLQRVEYRLEGGTLRRRHYLHVDGGPAAVTAELLDDVEAVEVRYRDRYGAWSETWEPERPDMLPLAVELIVTPTQGVAVRQLFLVGPV